MGLPPFPRKLWYLSTLCSVNAFTIFTAQYLSPQGYSQDTSGFVGATLLFAGIISAAIASPIFDRVLTRHLGITIKIVVPILSAFWLSLIWAGTHSELVPRILA